MSETIDRRQVLAIGASGILGLACPTLAQPKPSLRYNSRLAFDYARLWCAGGNNCPDGQFELDCTHFACHALRAGGVRVPGTGASCRTGLCIRVKELAEWLFDATRTYENVVQLAGYQDARPGDICIKKTWLEKTHVMLLWSIPVTVPVSGASVYAHTNNRCGEFAAFNVQNCVYYRIYNR